MNKQTIRSTVMQEREELLAQALTKLPGKILGYSEDIGLYELTVVSSGSTSELSTALGVSKQKHVLERGTGENFMKFSLVSRHLRWLQGEILTILEASIEDERRLKAVKDLVKDKISAKISWIYEQCGIPEDEEGLGEDEQA